MRPANLPGAMPDGKRGAPPRRPPLPGLRLQLRQGPERRPGRPLARPAGLARPVARVDLDGEAVEGLGIDRVAVAREREREQLLALADVDELRLGDLVR